MTNRAMTSLEACLLLILLASALMCTYKYFRGALQGNWKNNIDSFAEGQYDPRNSRDNRSDYIYISPRIHADMGAYGSRDIAFNNPASGTECPADTFGKPSVTGCLKLTNWGTYSDSDEHE
jgi:hypothetical protein